MSQTDLAARLDRLAKTDHRSFDWDHSLVIYQAFKRLIAVARQSSRLVDSAVCSNPRVQEEARQAAKDALADLDAVLAEQEARCKT